MYDISTVHLITGRCMHGILTYKLEVYTQHEFKLKFSALLKAYDGKYTENSKK